MSESILLQVGVKIFLKNKTGNYLLLKRSPIRYPNIKNCWDVPGGRIIPGSTLLENLRREVFEETRLKILGIPKLISAQDIIRRGDKHIVRLTYVARADGKPKLDEEHIDFKWLSIEEIKEIKDLDEFAREVIRKNLVN